MYKLVFEDHFDKDSKVNESYWNIDHSGGGFGNNELQYYTNRSENIYCKDSILHIVAKKENYEHREYTSAKITTHSKISIHYGIIEVRAKLPKGKGTWPAIWMLGENIKTGAGWPRCGEIDIMEYVGRQPDELHFSLHTESFNHRRNNNFIKTIKIDNVTDDFHTFKLIWEPEYIEFYVDDVCHARKDKGDLKYPDEYPFLDPQFLIINLAIGGNWGGPVDDSILPCELLVDYVKIYKKE